MMDRAFSAAATWLGRMIGRPVTFIAVALLNGFAIGWLVRSGFPDKPLNAFNLTISVVSLLLLFLLQHTQNRDGAAVQAKLDVLIKGMPDAQNDLIGADKLTEAEIEKLRDGCQP